MTDDQEFYEDFGDSGVSEAELNELLQRARLANDRPLRLLVKQFRALRTTAASALDALDDAQELPVFRESEVVRLLRFLARSKDAGPASPTQAS
jgi:hypothetical protein